MMIISWYELPTNHKFCVFKQKFWFIIGLIFGTVYGEKNNITFNDLY